MHVPKFVPFTLYNILQILNTMLYNVIYLAPWETATIKKDYNKVCDAYGCLGVLRLSLSKYIEDLLLGLYCVRQY